MTTATTKNRPAAPETEKKEAFNASKRCDNNCGAQAYVRAHKGGSELFFCIHHSRKLEPGLIAQGFDIDDRSWAL